MGLLGKTLGGFASKLKEKISQGIQGAKRFAGNVFETAKQGLTKAKDFVHENREAIGGALSAAAPFIGAINPALGIAASTGASFLQKLKPGPVKEKLAKLAEGNTTSGNAGVQQVVEQRRRANAVITRNRKRAKTPI